MPSEIYYTIFPTSAGWIGVTGSIAGLRRVILPRPSEKEVLDEISGGAIPRPDIFKDITTRLKDYFDGKPVDFPDEPDFSGATGFQREVWRAACRIPYGETRSYGWLSVEAGRPGSARAVGQALGRNPLPVIVPCHRVLAHDGSLGGFSGGLEMKRLLLCLEGNGQST
jgi:methylated-DNA-[protein]-cysteine S-methyltransferase